jgi:hypothetical protein
VCLLCLSVLNLSLFPLLCACVPCQQREEKRKQFEQQKAAMKADAAGGLRKMDQYVQAPRTCDDRSHHLSSALDFAYLQLCVFLSFVLLPDANIRMFSTSTSNEAQFKMAVIGLVSAEEYSAKRKELEMQQELAKAYVCGSRVCLFDVMHPYPDYR